MITSVSSAHICSLIAAREYGTTAMRSMSLEAFKHSLRTFLREVLSQFSLSPAEERPGLRCPPLRRPTSVFGVSMPGSGSMGSG